MAAERGRPCSAHLLRQLGQTDQTERGKAEEQAAQAERPACGFRRLAVDQKPSVVGHFALPSFADGRTYYSVANARAADGDQPPDERGGRNEMRAIWIGGIIRHADLNPQLVVAHDRRQAIGVLFEGPRIAYRAVSAQRARAVHPGVGVRARGAKLTQLTEVDGWTALEREHRFAAQREGERE